MLEETAFAQTFIWKLSFSILENAWSCECFPKAIPANLKKTTKPILTHTNDRISTGDHRVRSLVQYKASVPCLGPFSTLHPHHALYIEILGLQNSQWEYHKVSSSSLLPTSFRSHQGISRLKTLKRGWNIPQGPFSNLKMVLKAPKNQNYYILCCCRNAD